MTPRERLLRDKADLAALVERDRAERGDTKRHYDVMVRNLTGKGAQDDVRCMVERLLESAGYGFDAIEVRPR